MSKNNGGPAFPDFDRLTMLRSSTLTPQQKETIYIESRGMSLRDYFAAHAPAEYLGVVTLKVQEAGSLEDVATIMAVAAFMYADAMLKERSE